MADNDSRIHVRVTHVSGLAHCLGAACGALVSWKLPWRELENVTGLRCPRCNSVLEVAPHSAVTLMDVGGRCEVIT